MSAGMEIKRIKENLLALLVKEFKECFCVAGTGFFYVPAKNKI